MKTFKIASIVIISTITALYSAFLFILPMFVKLESFNSETIKDMPIDLIIKAEDIRLSTGWNLAVGAKIKQVNAYYKNGEKFAQIDNLDVKLSTLKLLLRQIKLDSISSENAILKIGVEKNGKFEIEKYIPVSENTTQSTSELPYGLKISNSMPNINIQKYSLSLIDNPTDKIYKIKGSDFKINDFDLTQKIKVQTLGEITLDGKKQFTYDIVFDSKIMPDLTAMNNTNKKQSDERVNIISILDNIHKLNLNADLKTDLKLSGKNDDIKADGTLDIKGLSVLVQGKQLPKSNLSLVFAGNKAKINSNIYTDINEFASVNGQFKHGKKPFLDLAVKSEKTDLKNLFAIVNALLPLAGIEDINGISANGNLFADFKVKSDFKNINSSGYLKISDANIYYKLFNIAMKDIQSDIDFSSNKINIKKAKANFNGAPLSAKGNIDTNAYANLSINADKIPLKGVLATLGQVQLLKENDIRSGNITMNATIKGKLNKTTPQIYIFAENINLKNKPNNALIKLQNGVVKASTNGVKTNGKFDVTNMKIMAKGLPNISVPKAALSFNEKDIKIDTAYMYLNNSKIDFFGDITDYTSKKSKIDLTAKGLLIANDIKSMLDKNLQKEVKTAGKLPLVIKVTGNDKVQDINAQLLANTTNYISIVDVNSLSGKTSLINASMKIANNNLKIHDISLNALSANHGLSGDFKTNLSNASKVLTIKGSINNLTAKNPDIQGIGVSIPSQITVSVPGFKNSAISAKGELNIGGTVSSPEIKGLINIPSAYIPTMKINGKNITANLTKNIIDVNCSKLAIDNSVMSLNTTISSNFAKGINIKSINIDANNVDLDTLAVALSKMPQNANAPGTNIGITLTNGKGKVARFATGGIEATNLNSDFYLANNTLYLKDMTGTAFGGKIAGNISYDILYNKTKINLQGRYLNAEPALRGGTGMKNLMQGSLDFDTTDITLVGTSMEQMMHSLKGSAGFIVSDGQMGTLGKLENLLYAQNILSNNVLKTTLGAIAKAVSIKKTGDFKYIKGKLTFSNGWANITSIQTSGPAMSMYITGKYNLLNNNATLIVLGRLSNEVVTILGPIGDFSVNKLISSIPKIGVITSNLINQMTTNPAGENLSMLPDLTPKTGNETREFKVSINGPVDSTSSVKYFKWLSTPTASTTIPAYNIPTSVEDVKDTVKQGAQNVLNSILAPVTTNTTQPSSNNPPQKRSGVADFINALPDLR